MNFNVPLLIVSLVYLLLIVTMFFLRKKQDNIENRLYKYLLLISVTGILLDLAGMYCHMHFDEQNLTRWLIVKLYLSYLLTFIYLLFAYVVSVCRNVESHVNDTKKIKKDKTYKMIINTFIISLIINFILPFEYFKEGTKVYIYGLNNNFVYLVGGILILNIIVSIIKNKKNIERKKILPMVLFILFGIPVVLTQMIFPEFLLITTLGSFIVVFMYHTIENPDLKMIEMLDIARNEADAANNAKTEFLSSMSHEIRTPLNAIVGFSQALEEEDLSEDAKKEVEDIITSSNNLLELVNGILDISKIEANKLEIINKEYEFKKIYNELITLVNIRLKDKDIIFNYSYDETVPNVLYGDYIRVKQVILNILTNACKYTKKGSIDFKINSIIKDGICRLIVSVEDTGIGIKESNIDKIFDKFERFDLQKNMTIEGTGLGLAITKKLVDLMHGKIIVQSVYGVGSKFTIVLDQKIVNKETVTSEKIITSKLKDFTNKKVLVVDDNKMNLKVAERLLRKYNLNLYMLDSGKKCIEEINKGITYDLILMDDMMPELSGTETLLKLKENNNYKIPTIALTANAISGMKEKYIESGFDDYLSKPINKYELENILNKFL